MFSGFTFPLIKEAEKISMLLMGERGEVEGGMAKNKKIRLWRLKYDINEKKSTKVTFKKD